MTTAVAAGTPGYPVRYDVQYPEELNRWLPLVKWLLILPHAIILYFLFAALSIITFLVFFVILFTKTYPKGLFDFVVGVYRWSVNVGAYAYLMRDEYPPFSMEITEFPATFEVDHPQELNRWLPLVKWLLAIPHVIVLIFLFIGLYLVLFIAFFAILFTKKFPQSLFNYTVGVNRWSHRVNAYVNLMRDEYPPFSMEP